MGLWDIFRDLSVSTWDRLGAARDVEYQVGEETITDLNVLELKRSAAPYVTTKTYTKRQEGKIGADWEWWFTGPSGASIGFRVQAKVVELKSDTYPHLHYKRRKKVNGRRTTVYQADELIRRAIKDAPARIPLYCLYTNSPATFPSILCACKRSIHPPGSYGCAITSAFRVRHSRMVKRPSDFQNLHPFLYPWHCLIWCPPHSESGKDLPTRVWEYWRDVILAADRRATFGADDREERVVGADDDLADLFNAYENITLTYDPPRYVTDPIRAFPGQVPGGVGAVLIVSESEHNTDRGVRNVD